MKWRLSRQYSRLQVVFGESLMDTQRCCCTMFFRIFAYDSVPSERDLSVSGA